MCITHFGKTRKPIIFMVSGPSGRDHDSPNQIFISSETRRHCKECKTNAETILKNIVLGNIRIAPHPHMEIPETLRAETSRRTV